MINEKGRVTFKQAWVDFWKGYVDFKGRTTRAGYWWMQLLEYLLSLIVMTVLLFEFVSLLGAWSASSFHSTLVSFASDILVWLIFLGGVGLAVLLPSIAVWVRRLRDAGLTGWGIFVLFLVELALAFNDSTTFLSAVLGIFFFVATLLPSDTMTTTSQADFVKFFLRSKENTEQDENVPKQD